MNYEKNYYDYIDYLKTINRTLDYSERHHIIPRCMGGTDDKSNIIELSAREHFLAHYLLMKMYPENYKLIDAFRMMGVVNSKEGQKRYINSRLYENAKKNFAKARSKPVVCIETGEIFPSAAYVERNIINGIRDVIKGKNLTAGGYHWRYLNEEPIIKEPFQRKKVICANTGEIFNNTDEAAKFAHVVPGLIRRNCNKQSGTAGGYTFYYYTGDDIEYPIRIIGGSKECPVRCIETGQIFNSIKEASKNKSDESNICKCCKGLKESHKGLHWEYYSNYTEEYKVKQIQCVETEIVYPNAVEAGKQFNSTSAARYIRQCCKGLRKTYKDYHWRYYND